MIAALFLLTVGAGPTATDNLPPPPTDDDITIPEPDVDVGVDVDMDADEPTVVDEQPAPAAPTPSVPPPKVAERKVRPVPSEEALARQSEADLSGRKGRVDRFGRPGSPQRFALEIKLGPYLPQVDRLYDGPGLGPYATIFGRTNAMGETTRPPRKGLMPVLGFEWQFWYLGGPIGIGTQIGFFRDSARAILAQPEPGENIRSGADRVSFMVIPVSMLLVYRFELLADRWKVPLVPYAKGGAAYGFWQTRNSNGLSRDSRGNAGRGGNGAGGGAGGAGGPGRNGHSVEHGGNGGRGGDGGGGGAGGNGSGGNGGHSLGILLVRSSSITRSDLDYTIGSPGAGGTGGSGSAPGAPAKAGDGNPGLALEEYEASL